MPLIYYISAAYIVLSLVLMMTRKYPQRMITMIPPVVQVASVFALNAMKFPIILTVVLLVVNLVIVLVVDMVEKKFMGLIPADEETDHTEDVGTASQTTSSNFVVIDQDLIIGSTQVNDDADLFSQALKSPELPKGDEVLIEPEKENKPINEVAPVQQEIFDASNNEIEEMIDNMVASGDMANAKRYLRMLAFFAKDDSSRKIAEKKLAELSAKEQLSKP